MPAAVAVPLIASAVGAGGSILSSAIGSSASSRAAQQQIAAQQRAEQLAKQATTEGQATAATGTAEANTALTESLKKQLELYSPYIQAGNESLGTLQQLAGANGPLDQQFQFNPQDLEKDPGYAFTLAQGQKAIQRSAAAQGGLFSSGTLKSLAGYTTGTANQYFNDAYNRAANTFSMNRSTALSRIGTLQGLAGMGYSGTNAAAQDTGNTGSQVAGNIFRTGEFNANLGMEGARTAAGLEVGKGNSEAAGTIGQANALSSGIGGATNSVNNGIYSYLLNRSLNNLAGAKPISGGIAGGAPAAAPYNPISAGPPPPTPAYPGGGLPGGFY